MNPASWCLPRALVGKVICCQEDLCGLAMSIQSRQETLIAQYCSNLSSESWVGLSKARNDTRNEWKLDNLHTNSSQKRFCMLYISLFFPGKGQRHASTQAFPSCTAISLSQCCLLSYKTAETSSTNGGALPVGTVRNYMLYVSFQLLAH